MRSHFAKTTALICATLVTLSSVAIADEYKNSVVNLKLDKTGANNLKVTVVTDKPYKAPLVVNEKANNRYVILMPETKNELKSKPVIDSISDTVRGFSIKTQPYVSGSCKGYTKIEIVSPKAINITTSTQISSQHSQPLSATKHSNQQINVAKIATAKQPLKNVVKQKQTKNSATKKTNIITQEISKPITKQVKHTATGIKTKLSTINLFDDIEQKAETQTNTKSLKNAKNTKSETIKNTGIKKPIKIASNIQKTKSNSNKCTIKRNNPSDKKITTQNKPVIKNNISTETISKTNKPSNIFEKEQKALMEETQTRSSIAHEINNSKLKNTESQQNIQKENKIKTAMSRLLNIQTGLVKLLLILSAVGFPIGAIFYIVMINKKLKQKAEETEFVNPYNEPVSNNEELNYSNEYQPESTQEFDNYNYQTEYVENQHIQDNSETTITDYNEPAEKNEIETNEETEEELMPEQEETIEQEETTENFVTEEDLDNIESAILNNTELEESEHEIIEEP